MIIQAFIFQKTSMAWVEQYMHQPQITPEILRKLVEGLR